MAYLASLVDFVHALAILAWVGGLPILFLARSERLRRAYAIYAIGFIALSWASRLLLDNECFLTRLSTLLWRQASPAAAQEPETWFTVRFAMAVFHLRPSHESIIAAWYVFVLVSCVGLLAHHRRSHPVATEDRAAPRHG